MIYKIADVVALEALVTKYIWEKFNYDKLKAILESSLSLKDFTTKLGYKAYHTQIKTQILKKYPDLKEQFDYLSHGGVNLINQKFYKLTVLSLNEEESIKQRHRCWNCQCECGRITVVRGTRLISGEIKSCLNCSKREDITGQVFGYLTAISINEEKTKERHDGRAYWNCKCKCGKDIIVSAHALKQLNTLSCGCYQESKGELKIEEILIKYNIPYIKQYSFDDLVNKKKLRFDFAIFKNNKIYSLIEYQGQQHYYPIEYFGGQSQFIKNQYLDGLKETYCKNNKIPLIKIPYTDYNKINLEYLQNIGGI